MALFPKSIKAAGVTFGHRQKSIVALARRGMLSEVMLEKVPFDYAKVGVDTGLNYAIKMSAKGRKAIHDIGWVPKSVLESGYGERLPLGAISKANVFYRGGRFDRFGLRVGLPEEGMFKGAERGLLHLSHRQALIGGGTIVGIGAGLAFMSGGTTDQLSKYHNTEIPGFPEQGLGPMQRKRITNFGSGWKGDLGNNKEAQEQFKFFTDALNRYGVKAGSGHKRIIIPKSIISESKLEDTLGFVKSIVAIPEAGQTSFTTYRHPDNLYHLHHHGKYWTMHKDRHPASTMILYNKDSSIEIPTWQKIKATIQGLPHVITEGIPGLLSYLKGTRKGVRSFAVRLSEQLPSEYMQQVEAMEESSIFSGKGSAYNTISGFSESGLAPILRKENTDFGSGYQGQKDKNDSFNYLKWSLIAGATLAPLAILSLPGKYLAITKRLLTGRTTLYHGASRTNIKAIQKEGILTSHGGKADSITNELLAGESVFTKAKQAVYLTTDRLEAAMYSGQSEMLGLNYRPAVDKVLFPVGAMLWTIRNWNKGIVKSNIPAWKKEFISTKIANPEFGEGNNLSSFIKALKIRARKTAKEQMDPEPPGFLTAYTAMLTYPSLKYNTSVYARNIGPEFIKGTKQFQKLGFQEWQEYVTKHPFQFGSGIALAATPIVAGGKYFYDKYSTIEGLQEGGIASVSRKVHTDFGSLWDPIRTLARGMNMSYKKFMRSREFQAAMREAIKGEPVKVLSKGGKAGSLQVAVYEGILRGKKFRTVYKEIPHDPKTFIKPYEKAYEFEGVQYMAEGETIAAKHLSKLPFERDVAPAIYGHTKKGKYISGVFQEYVPGATLAEVHAEAQNLAMVARSSVTQQHLSQAAKNLGLPISSSKDFQNIMKSIDDHIKYLHKQNISHGDLNIGNIMLTSKGPGFSIIDWGTFNLNTRLLPSVKKGIPPKGFSVMEADIDLDLRRLSDLKKRFLPGAPMAKTVKRQFSDRDNPFLQQFLASDSSKISSSSNIPGLKVSKVAPKLSDWDSPWQGPIVSGQISEAMVTAEDLGDFVNYAAKNTSQRMAQGTAPAMVGITGEPSPNLPNLNDNLPELIRPMASAQLGLSQTKMYLQDNVPLSTKIQIKGRVNSHLNLNELSQAVSSNIPKSKVNIYINDNRSKLTPQYISDMIEK